MKKQIKSPNVSANGKANFILLSCIFLLSAVLSGCGVDTPQFKGKKLFVVDKIENENDSLCRYIAKDWTLDYFFSFNHPQIVAEKGLFQIGDTVCVSKHSR